MRPALQVSGLTKRFGQTHAVDALDLTFAPGSFTSLLGPSGCGKSTTLQMIAGLIPPDLGTVTVDGSDMTHVSPERRPISLVFQKPLLFPHLTVEQNIGFGLRMQHVPRAVIADSVAEMLEQVRLTGLGGRRPHELSGGQEQRVALARALVLRPAVLLLDEPFSQLDATLRIEMRRLVRELHDSTGVSTVFVTHDQDEAVDIADEIVLMLDGRVEAQGSPERLFEAPPTLATARFLGVANELFGHAHAGGFRLAGTDLATDSGAVRGEAVLTIRPEAVELPARSATRHALIVESVRFAGTFLAATGRTVDGQLMTLHLPVGAPLVVGEAIEVGLPADRCSVFARGTA
ncbi:ABC transporter ATP-binding protein [Aeromicrobium sp.]|uniref:ABC transporter ATP-binding protein n=1 Tax=Aeromicrobium sp. TaxID=1871063 RepID=UPI0030C199F1